jgi:hypothetical protein
LHEHVGTGHQLLERRELEVIGESHAAVQHCRRLFDPSIARPKRGASRSDDDEIVGHAIADHGERLEESDEVLVRLGDSDEDDVGPRRYGRVDAAWHVEPTRVHTIVDDVRRRPCADDTRELAACEVGNANDRGRSALQRRVHGRRILPADPAIAVFRQGEVHDVVHRRDEASGSRERNVVMWGPE